MYFTSPVVVIVSLFLSLSPTSASEGSENIADKVILFACYSCHGGVNGDGDLGMPQLNGINAAKLQQLLVDFKYDRKSASIMGRISKGFTQAELKNVARAFSQLKNEE